MDQDASKEDSEEQTPSILHHAGQLESESATPYAITTPEAEMDIDLPQLARREELDDSPRKETRMEIPDSEEASELSSPVKINSRGEENRVEAADMDGGLQTELEASEQSLEQEDPQKSKWKVSRIEILDSEEASEFSSPVKLVTRVVKAVGGAMKRAGGLDTTREGQEQEVGEGDTTMMDVSSSLQEDGIVEGGVSRAEDTAALEGVKTSDTKPLESVAESVEATKEIGCKISKDECLSSSGSKDDNTGQRASPEGTQNSPSADISSSQDKTKNREKGFPSVGEGEEATGPQITPVKGQAGVLETPARTAAEVPLISPATEAKVIAIAARKLLNEISPTVSDISDTSSKLALLNASTEIPNSDDDDNDELPDAPSTMEHVINVPGSNRLSTRNTLLPAATEPAVMEEGIPKASETSATVTAPEVGINGHGEEKDLGVSTTSFKEGNRQLGDSASSETISSPAKLSALPRFFKDASPPIPSIRQRVNDGDNSSTLFASGIEDHFRPQPPSSPVAPQVTRKPAPQSPEQPTVAIAESFQATDTASSPLKPLNGAFFQATKRKESPNASFTAPEPSQSKDVLMAELKAMKIASIQNRISSLETEIAAKRAKLEEVTKDLKQPAAKTVKRHIKLLHDYNDIRDVGQGLVGMIADNRGVRIGELYEEFGVGLKD